MEIFLLTAILYFFAGFFFAIGFVVKGVDVVDEDAHGSSFGFRLVIIPGVIVFWPVLLKKWLNAKRKKND